MTAVRFAWERQLYRSRDSRITTGTVAVGAALASYADITGISFPGTERLSQDARMTVRSARTHLNCLETIGAIRRLTMGRKNVGTSRWLLIAPSEWLQAEATAPLSTTASGGSHNPAESPQGETIDRSGGSHSPVNRPRTDHRVAVVSKEDLGDGDDELSEDHRSELVVLRLQAAQSTKEVAAVRAANPWAFERPYVQDACLARLDQLDPVPEFLR